jgi:hypothetical protein
MGRRTWAWKSSIPVRFWLWGPWRAALCRIALSWSYSERLRSRLRPSDSQASCPWAQLESLGESADRVKLGDRPVVTRPCGAATRMASACIQPGQRSSQPAPLSASQFAFHGAVRKASASSSARAGDALALLIGDPRG